MLYNKKSKNGSNPSENKEENVRKIFLSFLVTMYLISCKERQGEYILRVSFPHTLYTIDVVRDTVIDGGLVHIFTYDTTSATFGVEVRASEGNYTPIIVIDSYKIYFYDLSGGTPQRIYFEVAPVYQDSVSIEKYKYLLYKTHFEIKSTEEVTTILPVLPSYIKRYYNPFYQVWRNRNPKVLFLKAVYEFYSHELFSEKKLEPFQAEITLEVSDYGK